MVSTISGKRNSYKTETKSGTPIYRAPESSKGATSRPYDIWSLGCVYLEILVWFTEGYSGLKKFRGEREDHVRPHGMIDEGFFHETPTGDQLREPVVAKIAELSRACASDLKAIADVIPSLLKIEPKDRLTASELAAQLQYLDTGASTRTQVPHARGSLLVPNNHAPYLPTYEEDSDEFPDMVKITGPIN